MGSTRLSRHTHTHINHLGGVLEFVVTPVTGKPAAQLMPSIRSAAVTAPHFPLTRTGRIFAFQLMPAMPAPLLVVAPIIPATCEPCQELSDQQGRIAPISRVAGVDVATTAIIGINRISNKIVPVQDATCAKTQIVIRCKTAVYHSYNSTCRSSRNIPSRRRIDSPGFMKDSIDIEILGYLKYQFQVQHTRDRRDHLLVNLGHFAL